MDTAMCYCSFMAFRSELALVSQTDSAPREALWATQGCGNVSLGVTESSPLDDVHFSFSLPPLPEYQIFRGAVSTHLLQLVHHFGRKYEAALLKMGFRVFSLLCLSFL